MKHNERKNYSYNSGLSLLQELFDNGHYVFTTEEARNKAQTLNISDKYFLQLLHLLAQTGWITRLRRGLYTLKEGFPANIQLHPFVIAVNLIKPSTISHWSAMNHHGLSEQIPITITAMTTKKVVTPEMRKDSILNNNQKHTWNISGIKYEYITVKPAFYFGIEEVWVNQNFKVPVTDKERTMLEAFASPSFFGGMGETINILEENISELNLERLISYALLYGKSSVSRRLGWALEHIGIAGEKIKTLADVSACGYSILDPGRPWKGPCNSYWKIQENLSERIKYETTSK